MRAPTLLLALVATVAAGCSGADDPTRTTSNLSCQEGGAWVPCTLTLTEAATFTITLVSRDCLATATEVQLTAPESVAGVVVDNACNATPGQVWAYDDDGAAFAPDTEIDMLFTSDQFADPPGVRVTGAFPEWTVNFEDGDDIDFNDVVLRVTAFQAAAT